MEKVPFLNKMFRYKAYSHSFFRMKCTFYVVLDAAPYFQIIPWLIATLLNNTFFQRYRTICVQVFVELF